MSAAVPGAVEDTKKLADTLFKYHDPIGVILVTFSEIEHEVESRVAFLLHDRSDEIGINVMMFLDYSDKVKLFGHLCQQRFHHTNPEYKPRVKELRKLLISAGEIRNIIAHAKWFSVTEDGFVRSSVKVDAEQGIIKFKYYKLTKDVLNELSEKLFSIQEELDSFIDDTNLI